MRQLIVSLADRSYPILIASGLLARVDLIVEKLSSRHVAIVSNDTVAPLYLKPLSDKLRDAGVKVTEIILADGEKYKNSATLGQIYDALLEARCDRGTTLIALGGGVVGDLAGYAAATYQRGIPFIQIPTTLLSQVDSSVGGKTGINHPLGKNMIGAFWQPQLVLADTDTISTLPGRELSAGLAEIIKYGLIRDAEFLIWLESNVEQLVARDSAALSYAIECSCTNKAEVVAGDERETSKEGGRALLNLGHTFGHAIETGLGYGVWLHGEAVAAGMVMAAELSCRLGWISRDDVSRTAHLLKRAGLPVRGPALGVERYWEMMGHDKKVIAGALRLVLLKHIGEAVTWEGAPKEDVLAAIAACCDG
ncbi:MAG: 3-dehydroquinate synthase [Proteobacteria bacterium]|nr:3-dehydroquinate synthase [Pseudomonadota bacterium]HQR05056.1 3-dehydroquinate synthase [Rhodocyclaceae bacterium]